MGLRAHEIVENAEQFELTGRTDYGSGTDLATANANIDGTREILALLRPLLTARDPRLAALDRDARPHRDAPEGPGPGGTWTPLADLTRGQREQVERRLRRPAGTTRPGGGDLRRTEDGMTTDTHGPAGSGCPYAAGGCPAPEPAGGELDRRRFLRGAALASGRSAPSRAVPPARPAPTVSAASPSPSTGGPAAGPAQDAAFHGAHQAGITPAQAVRGLRLLRRDGPPTGASWPSCCGR